MPGSCCEKLCLLTSSSSASWPVRRQDAIARSRRSGRRYRLCTRRNYTGLKGSTALVPATTSHQSRGCTAVALGCRTRTNDYNRRWSTVHRTYTRAHARNSFCFQTLFPSEITPGHPNANQPLNFHMNSDYRKSHGFISSPTLFRKEFMG